MRRVRYLILILATVLTFSALAADPIADILAAMRKLDLDVAEPLQKAPRLEQSLANIVAATPKDSVRTLSDEQLRDRYEAARLTAFYANSPASMLQMRRAWDELDRRGDPPAGSADDLVTLYVAARQFVEAEQFSTTHASAVSVRPPVLDGAKTMSADATVLAVADNGARLVQQPFSWQKQSRVVVIGAPDCHFSREAAAAIQSDTQLSAMMATHAVWLMPQQVVRDFSAVARWNREHPQASLSLIYRQSEWPFIHSLATPAFYFFKDGQLVASFNGWTGAEQKKAVLDGLARMGL